jgi:hypothetical protein
MCNPIAAQFLRRALFGSRPFLLRFLPQLLP